MGIVREERTLGAPREMIDRRVPPARALTLALRAVPLPQNPGRGSAVARPASFSASSAPACRENGGGDRHDGLRERRSPITLSRQTGLRIDGRLAAPNPVPPPGRWGGGTARSAGVGAPGAASRWRPMMLRIIPLLALIFVAIAKPAAAQDEAEAAWRAGDTRTAERLYSARLAADSNDVRALHRVALIRAWAERYDESLALLDRLLRLEPGNTEARIDRARVIAWRGNPAAAARELDPVLAGDPANLAALQARAQFESWAGAHDAALADYRAVQQLTPGDRSTDYERARVLSWASRFGAAAAVYDSLLRSNPNDRQALMGLGQVLAWSARLDSAEVLYRRVLARDPADVEALRWMARVAAWNGRLVEAERRWRAVLARHPNDAAALVGLSATLRWQGRGAAALESARRAVAAAPTDRDARTELQWARLPMRPRAAPSFTYESDSDGNRISTFVAGAAFRPSPRVEVRGDGYLRGASADGLEGSGTARGGALTLWAQAEPGWALAAGLGVTGTDRGEAETRPTWRAALSSPGRYPLTASLSYARQVLDGTLLLMERGVEQDEVGLAATLSPGGRWVVSGGGGAAWYHGRVSGRDNRRVNGNLAVTRRVGSALTFGVSGRAFGFAEDLSDGYFDPDLYALGELLARFGREGSRWGVSAEVAPGVQQVGRDGEPSGSFRATGGVSYLIAPGRRIDLSAVFANSGLSSISPAADADYRYTAFGVSGSWAF